MMNTNTFLCTSYIFSVATRERCMANMRKFRVPRGWEGTTPTAPNGAVLIPVCTIDDKPSLLYSIRSPNLKTHSGQIAFPGGKMRNEETPIQAALRETTKLIGLAPAKVDVWGHGPPIPGRNQRILITPVIGTIMDLSRADITINKKEVEEVFAIPMDMLCDPKNQFYTQFRNGYVLPVFMCEDYKIWGITAYLTHTFLQCLLPKDIYKNEWTKKKIEIKDDSQLENLII